MSKEVEKKKVYQPPEVRRVELALSEVVLGTGCFTATGDAQEVGCGNVGQCVEPG